MSTERGSREGDRPVSPTPCGEVPGKCWSLEFDEEIIASLACLSETVRKWNSDWRDNQEAKRLTVFCCSDACYNLRSITFQVFDDTVSRVRIIDHEYSIRKSVQEKSG